MQLNKSDDGGDEDDDGGEEEEEEEDRGGVTDHGAFSRCSDGFCYFLIIERLFRRTAQTGQSQEVKTEGEGGTWFQRGYAGFLAGSSAGSLDNNSKKIINTAAALPLRR